MLQFVQMWANLFSNVCLRHDNVPSIGKITFGSCVRTWMTHGSWLMGHAGNFVWFWVFSAGRFDDADLSPTISPPVSYKPNMSCAGCWSTFLFINWSHSWYIGSGIHRREIDVQHPRWMERERERERVAKLELINCHSNAVVVVYILEGLFIAFSADHGWLVVNDGCYKNWKIISSRTWLSPPLERRWNWNLFFAHHRGGKFKNKKKKNRSRTELNGEFWYWKREWIIALCCCPTYVPAK